MTVPLNIAINVPDSPAGVAATLAIVSGAVVCTWMTKRRWKDAKPNPRAARGQPQRRRPWSQLIAFRRILGLLSLSGLSWLGILTLLDGPHSWWRSLLLGFAFWPAFIPLAYVAGMVAAVDARRADSAKADGSE